MYLASHRCENCGAKLPKTEQSHVVCSYCGSYYQKNEVKEMPAKVQFVPDRPRIIFDYIAILFCMLIVPAFIYFLVIAKRKYEWDKQYKQTPRGQYYFHHPKPQFSFIFLIILINAGVFPGLIYYLIYQKKSKKWHQEMVQFEHTHIVPLSM